MCVHVPPLPKIVFLQNNTCRQKCVSDRTYLMYHAIYLIPLYYYLILLYCAVQVYKYILLKTPNHYLKIKLLKFINIVIGLSRILCSYRSTLLTYYTASYLQYIIYCNLYNTLRDNTHTITSPMQTVTFIPIYTCTWTGKKPTRIHLAYCGDKWKLMTARVYADIIYVRIYGE